MIPLSATLSPQYNFTPAPLVPRYITSALNRACDAIWERRLDIVTTGGAPSKFPDAYHYGCLAYRTYFSICDRLSLGSKDVVVDLGAGKGRVVCVAGTYPIKRSIGIEIDADLCRLGEVNGRRMRSRRAPVEFICRSAADYDFAEASVVMLFNPFGADTMREVLDQLHQSLVKNPRPLRIVYGNPILSSMLAAKPWLELYECWQPGMWSRHKFPVHFFRAR